MSVHVLLIDDNLPDRVRYRRMLQRGDALFEISEAADGASGLALLAGGGQRFDCILLDQDLPDLQGLDLLEDIREQLADPPPVVMLTGEEDAAVSIEALRRGAADYLMKRRIDEDRLLRAVRGAIDRRALENRLRDQQQRLSRFYRLANQTEDALFFVDAATTQISDCNEAARRRLRLSSGGDGSEVPAAFADREAWREFCRQAETQGSARMEWQVEEADGSEVVIEIAASRVEEDGHPYIVAVGRDISLRKQYERELLERALRDGLTGVWNRRAFDERLLEYWRSGSRHRRPLAILMVDIDHFKLYNDTLGHPAGDDCLRQVAQALKNDTLRSNSLLARYGGEEFVALIEDADLAAARLCAERMQRAIAALAIPHPASGTAPQVTVSIGIASRQPSEASTPQALVCAADAALYAAKNAGRNRVEAEAHPGMPA